AIVKALRERVNALALAYLGGNGDTIKAAEAALLQDLGGASATGPRPKGARAALKPPNGAMDKAYDAFTAKATQAADLITGQLAKVGDKVADFFSKAQGRIDPARARLSEWLASYEKLRTTLATGLETLGKRGLAATWALSY